MHPALIHSHSQSRRFFRFAFHFGSLCLISNLDIRLVLTHWLCPFGIANIYRFVSHIRFWLCNVQSWSPQLWRRIRYSKHCSQFLNISDLIFRGFLSISQEDHVFKSKIEFNRYLHIPYQKMDVMDSLFDGFLIGFEQISHWSKPKITQNMVEWLTNQFLLYFDHSISTDNSNCRLNAQTTCDHLIVLGIWMQNTYKY